MSSRTPTASRRRLTTDKSGSRASRSSSTPLQTALFLADLRLDANTLAAALLHDVIEDCDVRVEELEADFGPEVAKLVDGVTKLTKTELTTVERSPGHESGSEGDLAQAATLRKMLMAMAEDIRVVLIKLGDRLHNLRTLSALPRERRIAMAKETVRHLCAFGPQAWDVGNQVAVGGPRIPADRARGVPANLEALEIEERRTRGVHPTCLRDFGSGARQGGYKGRGHRSPQAYL